MPLAFQVPNGQPSKNAETKKAPIRNPVQMEYSLLLDRKNSGFMQERLGTKQIRIKRSNKSSLWSKLYPQ